MTRVSDGMQLWFVVLLLGAVSGAAPAAPAVRVAEPPGVWTGNIDAPVPSTLRGGAVIHTGRLAAFVAASKPILIDVSNAPAKPPYLTPGAPWLPVPHRVLAHAVWLPGTGLGDVTPAVQEFYATQLASLSGGNRDASLVIYCHARCWLSWNAARRAVDLGYRRVYWYPDGIEGWVKAGLPTEVAQARIGG